MSHVGAETARVQSLKSHAMSGGDGLLNIRHCGSLTPETSITASGMRMTPPHFPSAALAWLGQQGTRAVAAAGHSG
jgi:hypothetical protein